MSFLMKLPKSIKKLSLLSANSTKCANYFKVIKDIENLMRRIEKNFSRTIWMILKSERLRDKDRKVKSKLRNSKLHFETVE